MKVLYTVISERSVSRAAMRLQSTQPMVSAQLKRLRELTGDPLLVRSGQGLAPTDAALAMLEPASRLLREAETLFAPQQRSGPFEPASAALTFRIAASDYLDPLFLPRIVELLKREAPQAQVELHPLSAEIDYRRKLASGEVDLVIGNWLQPPEELHLGRLMSDEIVCLVAPDHPRRARRPRLDGGALPAKRACGADGLPFRRAGRHRRAPGRAGPAAQHGGAQRALQPDPADGGAQLAGADHRAAVLQRAMSTRWTCASCAARCSSRR